MNSTVPRGIYIDGEGWISTPVAEYRKQLQTLAKEEELTNLTQVAEHLAITYLLPVRRDDLIERVVIANLYEEPDVVEKIKQDYNLKTNAEFEAHVIDQIRKTPDRFEALPLAAKLEVNRLLTEEVLPEVPIWAGRIHQSLMAVNNDNEELPTIDESSYEMMDNLRQAYLAGDAESFNSILESELASVSENPPEEYRAYRMGAEKIYNGFAPFYVATVLYTFGCIITLLAWMGSRKINWLAFSMIAVALLVQVFGIYLRVVISGRPPITNLYSSFVVVTGSGGRHHADCRVDDKDRCRQYVGGNLRNRPVDVVVVDFHSRWRHVHGIGGCPRHAVLVVDPRDVYLDGICGDGGGWASRARVPVWKSAEQGF